MKEIKRKGEYGVQEYTYFLSDPDYDLCKELFAEVLEQ